MNGETDGVDTSLSTEIDLLRKTANSLMAFKFERRTSEQWSKYWGCLDTLRDMDESIHELLKAKRKPTRAECMGFLQILVSQQDAVYHLSQCVGLVDWKPANESELEIIRELRNRITSHSAWSDRSKDGINSTSMINWSDIREGGFQAVVYRSRNSNDYPLYEEVDFDSFLKTNITNLKPQVQCIVNEMCRIEELHKEKLRRLDWSFLDNKGDGYLREKMWSPWENDNNRLWQASRHAIIFNNRLTKAKVFFKENEIYEISEYELNALIAASEKLKSYLEKERTDEKEKLEYYVFLLGFNTLWKRFDDEVSSLIDSFSLKD